MTWSNEEGDIAEEEDGDDRGEEGDNDDATRTRITTQRRTVRKGTGCMNMKCQPVELLEAYVDNEIVNDG